MIREPRNYKSVEVYNELSKLPPGGYVIKVMNSKVEDNNGKQVLILQFDIVEGEYENFFKENYYGQTQEDRKWKGIFRLWVPTDDDEEWKLRQFKTNMNAFEGSNEGYAWNWDEATLKDKICGALFRNKEYEYEGRHGFFTECFKLMDADKIRDGEFKPPADKLLNPAQAPQTASPSAGFGPINDDDIPF